MRKQAFTSPPGLPEAFGALGSKLVGGSMGVGAASGFLADKAALLAALQLLASGMPLSSALTGLVGGPVAAGLAGAGAGRLWKGLSPAMQQRVLAQIPTFVRGYRGAGNLTTRMLEQLRGKFAEEYWQGFMTKCAEEGLTGKQVAAPVAPVAPVKPEGYGIPPAKDGLGDASYIFGPARKPPGPPPGTPSIGSLPAEQQRAAYAKRYAPGGAPAQGVAFNPGLHKLTGINAEMAGTAANPLTNWALPAKQGAFGLGFFLKCAEEGLTEEQAIKLAAKAKQLYQKPKPPPPAPPLPILDKRLNTTDVPGDPRNAEEPMTQNQVAIRGDKGLTGVPGQNSGGTSRQSKINPAVS